jgi:hypothetical protein
MPCKKCPRLARSDIEQSEVNIHDAKQESQEARADMTPGIRLVDEDLNHFQKIHFSVGMSQAR